MCPNNNNNLLINAFLFFKIIDNHFLPQYFVYPPGMFVSAQNSELPSKLYLVKMQATRYLNHYNKYALGLKR